jgi:hypothetical protein
VVYAFDAGGAVLVATYVASRTLLSVAMMLGITGVSGRVQPGQLLRRVTWLRAVFLALAALTAFLHGSPAGVIALAAASSSLSGTYRPLQVTILPWLVRTPAELTSSNAIAAVLENSGALAGPLLAGGMLVLAAAPASMAPISPWSWSGSGTRSKTWASLRCWHGPPVPVAGEECSARPSS